ncbi:TNT domain-containing protein, partial [Paracoccus onubensis]|uniref:TNT domain-containing protein n=1 Tax=Paracoccus onubensis TaxID=1675788 RepID=UPI002731481D
KVHQLLASAGAATARVAAQIFDFMSTISGKLIDLIRALLRNRTGKGEGAVGEEIPIVRRVERKVPPNRQPFHRKDLGDEWYDPETGGLRWPPNDGFADTPVNDTLLPKTRIDRYSARTGELDTGSFLSPEGASFDSRALPYDPATQTYSVYEVVKPLSVESGAAAPWFGTPGGAIQYKTGPSVGDLVKDGYLKQIQ